eukprot:c35575_g1_i1 orf=3-194(-)
MCLSKQNLTGRNRLRAILGSPNSVTLQAVNDHYEPSMATSSAVVFPSYRLWHGLNVKCGNAWDY